MPDFEDDAMESVDIEDFFVDTSDQISEEIVQDDLYESAEKNLEEYDQGKESVIEPHVTSVPVSSAFSGDGCLYFDLETIPDYKRLESKIEKVEPKNPDIEPSDLIKENVSKIKTITLEYPRWTVEYRDAAIDAEKKGKGRLTVLDMCKRQPVGAGGEMTDDMRKRFATTPETCRIVMMGLAVGDGDIEVYAAHNDGEERALLMQFWQMVYSCHPIVGYNILHFDLPVIFIRSAILRVPISRRINMSPYKGDVIDLMIARFGRGKPMKMKEFAGYLGINVPAGETDGSQVESLLREDPQKLAEYSVSDVHVTREIRRMLRGTFVP